MKHHTIFSGAAGFLSNTDLDEEIAHRERVARWAKENNDHADYAAAGLEAVKAERARRRSES